MFAVMPRLNEGALCKAPGKAAAATAALLLGVAALSLMAASASAAKAQSAPCAPREAIVERLALDFGEEPIGVAVTASGDLLEVLASPQGSWSIIITEAGGPTCLMSAGEGWRGAPAQAAKEPRI